MDRIDQTMAGRGLQEYPQWLVLIDYVAFKPILNETDQAENIHPAIAHFLQSAVDSAEHFLVLEGVRGKVDFSLFGEMFLCFAMDTQGCE